MQLKRPKYWVESSCPKASRLNLTAKHYRLRVAREVTAAEEVFNPKRNCLSDDFNCILANRLVYSHSCRLVKP